MHTAPFPFLARSWRQPRRGLHPQVLDLVPISSRVAALSVKSAQAPSLTALNRPPQARPLPAHPRQPQRPFRRPYPRRWASPLSCRPVNSTGVAPPLTSSDCVASRSSPPTHCATISPPRHPSLRLAPRHFRPLKHSLPRRCPQDRRRPPTCRSPEVSCYSPAPRVASWPNGPAAPRRVAYDLPASLPRFSLVVRPRELRGSPRRPSDALTSAPLFCFTCSSPGSRGLLFTPTGLGGGVASLTRRPSLVPVARRSPCSPPTTGCLPRSPSPRGGVAASPSLSDRGPPSRNASAYFALNPVRHVSCWSQM
ncbi:hypothetical protein Efla_001381 [Eimeria flavescens]